MSALKKAVHKIRGLKSSKGLSDSSPDPEHPAIPHANPNVNGDPKSEAGYDYKSEDEAKDEGIFPQDVQGGKEDEDRMVEPAKHEDHPNGAALKKVVEGTYPANINTTTTGNPKPRMSLDTPNGSSTPNGTRTPHFVDELENTRQEVIDNRKSLERKKVSLEHRRDGSRARSSSRKGSRIASPSPGGTGTSTPNKGHRKSLVGLLTRSSSQSSENPLNDEGEPMSKHQMRKQAKRESMELRQQINDERQREIDLRRMEEDEKAAQEEPEELRKRYGNLPINQSQQRIGQARARIAELRESMIDTEIIMRARVHTSRAMSAKLVFLVLRQQECTLQAVLDSHEAHVSSHMVKWVERIPIESVVLVKGRLTKPVQTVKGATVHLAELKIDEIHVVSEVTDHLAFDVYEDELSKEDEISGENRTSHISDRTRLANRIIDLRTKTAQSIFRIQSGVGNAFRNYLDSQGFIEIHTPKLQGGATESGASVFKVEYFGRKAFLAQSPQLAKQMSIAADFERVYEVGPVFRAENSNTHRHLTEYVGLDLEMAFEEHYHEVLDVIDEMFKNVFKTLYERYDKEMKIVQEAYPHKDLVWLDKTPRIPFKDGIKILVESGYKDEGDKIPSEYEDLTTRGEIRLGQLIKEKYNTDFYILDKFPASARPFYTMPDPNNPKTTNSFDIFIRGQEVLSGGQRIHDAKMLEDQMLRMGVQPEEMEEYMEGFRFGAPCHAGGGIGLERVVMLLLNLGNIRHASLFPRDPKSLPALPPVVKLRHPEASTLAPPIMRRPATHPNEAMALQPIEKLIANYGDATNTSWLDDRYQVWRDTTGAAIGYVIQDHYCMIFGNPLCDKSQVCKTVSNFLKHLKKETKYKPIWMLVDRETETCLAEKFGWSTLSCVAEERLDPSINPADADKDLARKMRHATKEGVVVHDVPPDKISKEVMEQCDKRMQDWLHNRKGQQVHLTQLNPWRDMEHRRYFYATDANETVAALVVMAQLSFEHGYQVKYALEFPGAPSGTIELIISHALKDAAAVGAASVTFGASAVDTLTPGHNLSGLRTKMLAHSYHAITTTLKLTRKTEFREKLGAKDDPVYVCFPKGVMGPTAIKAVMKVFGDGDD